MGEGMRRENPEPDVEGTTPLLLQANQEDDDQCHSTSASSSGSLSSSVVKTFGNIIISIVGAGVLGLPYAYRKTGWLVCIIILVCVGLMSYYGMLMVVWASKAVERDRRITTLSGLAFHIYGVRGSVLVDCLIVLSQAAFCIGYLIFIGENLASVFGSDVSVGPDVSAHVLDWVAALFSSKTGYIWIIFLVQVALASIKSLTTLAPFSIAADISNAVAMIIVMQQDITTIAKNGIASTASAIASTTSASHSFSNIIFVIGVAIYSFIGIGLALPLESNMTNRKKFGGTLAVAMTFVTLLYITFGLLGYLAFGDDTLDIITLNLPTTWRTAAIKCALCFGLLFTFPVMMYPVHEVAERHLAGGRATMWLRTLIILAATIIAASVPQFSVFLSFVGNTICCILAFVIPVIFYRRASLLSVNRFRV